MTTPISLEDNGSSLTNLPFTAVFQMQRVLSDTLFSCDPDTRMVYLQVDCFASQKSWKHELLQMFPKYVNAKKVIFWQASPRFLLRSCSGAPSSLRQMTKRASVRLFTATAQRETPGCQLLTPTVKLFSRTGHTSSFRIDQTRQCFISGLVHVKSNRILI